MSDRPWYPHYSADFVHGVVGLGAAEIGTYIVILDLIYDRGQPIINDPKRIGAILGEGPRKTRALIGRLIAAGKLIEVDGRLENNRARKERENIAKTSRKTSEIVAKNSRNRCHIEENQLLSDAGSIMLSRARATTITTTKEKKGDGKDRSGEKSGEQSDYSDQEIAGLQLEFDTIDVPSEIETLEAWADGKGIIKPNERKIAIYGALKGKHELRTQAGSLIAQRENPPTISVSDALANSRLARAKH